MWHIYVHLRHRLHLHYHEICSRVGDEVQERDETLIRASKSVKWSNISLWISSFDPASVLHNGSCCRGFVLDLRLRTLLQTWQVASIRGLNHQQIPDRELDELAAVNKHHWPDHQHQLKHILRTQNPRDAGKPEWEDLQSRVQRRYLGSGPCCCLSVCGSNYLLALLCHSVPLRDGGKNEVLLNQSHR